METATKKALIEHLRQFITPNKWQKFNEVLPHRTRQVTVAVENVYQPQNASAVIRTCDLLGIQDLHVIENDNAYRMNPNVTLGASKWVDLHRYSSEENNTVPCIEELRSRGYRIIATTPHKDDCLLEELPLDGKMAFLFGKENKGLSDDALENSDEFLRIPMFGFTESFNLSVSAAIVLSSVMRRLRENNKLDPLSEEEVIDLKLKWLKKLVRRHQLIESEFLKSLS